MFQKDGKIHTYIHTVHDIQCPRNKQQDYICVWQIYTTMGSFTANEALNCFTVSKRRVIFVPDYGSNCGRSFLELTRKAQSYWVLGLCPSSSILETRKYNISETGSVFVLRWGGKTPIQLGPLERANVIHFFPQNVRNFAIIFSYY
jgi:hypothetical protein